MKRLLFLLCFLPALARAEPILVMNQSGIQIMLYNDPCKIKAPSNLGYRVTWAAEGKVIEGCFGVFAPEPSIGAYFEDDTMAVIPAELFKPVVSL